MAYRQDYNKIIQWVSDIEQNNASPKFSANSGISIATFADETRYDDGYDQHTYGHNIPVISESMGLMRIAANSGKDLQWWTLEGSFHCMYDPHKSVDAIKAAISATSNVADWFNNGCIKWTKDHYDLNQHMKKHEAHMSGYYTKEAYAERWSWYSQAWYYLFGFIYNDEKTAAKIKLTGDF
ncbi:hypothetical protein KBX73_02970 [Acetobacter persici]|uniref:hypothetical protein n=1 Tax=Acetobacter persici TaxID=1076596 RepID=UPI0020CC7F73|nr:hypothetical protein [Acetobacter persici]MCP9318753.1 hypothetical protein [Acetobacter persici]